MPASAADGGTLLHVKVVPGASRTAVAGRHGDVVRIRVAAPPEKGKANRELEAFLAGLLGVRRNDVAVVRGISNAHKTVRVAGLAPGEILARLLP